MPKVSIIIPAYNCAEYLLDSVPSALSQTFRDLEVVIVDDGSTDNTHELIKKNFTDPRVIYVKQDHSGLSSARNKGIEVSGGEYIAFLDADDLFLDQKIEKGISAVEEHPKAGIIYTTEKYFYENDREKSFASPHEKSSGDLLFFLKRSNFIHVSTVMARRSVIQGTSFDPGLKSHEDWDWFLKLSAKGIDFFYLPEALSLVRVRKKSMTAKDAVMDSSRRIVGERAKMLWSGLKRDNFIRYALLKTRAAFSGFPGHPRFNRPSLFKDICGICGPRLIFGSSVHEDFGSFLDLYKGVRKFFNDPLYVYATNENIGKPAGNLVKIESRRNYKWRRSHNFIFDAVEQLEKYDYDFFIALDSDCLVCGSALLDFLKGGGFDFVIYPNLNGLGSWYHGNVFRENINLYLGILRDLGIQRKDDTIMGNFNPMIILSKRCVDFLHGKIAKIEASPSYSQMMKLDFSVGETLIFNILKDAGFRPGAMDQDLKRGLRYRPYWEAEEFTKGIWLYHPVRRKRSDLFRRLAGLEARYDRNFSFIVPIYAYKFYKAVKSKPLSHKESSSGEESAWFNP